MFMIIDNFYRLICFIFIIVNLSRECQYECRPFGCRRTLQGDTASRKAHDLAGDGKPDTAAALFGGEERDENVFGLFLRDHRPVVADLDQDGFFLVAIGIDLDQSVFLFAADRLHGVLKQVQDYLRDQVLVCIDDQVGRLYADSDRDVGEIGVMAG